MSHVSAHDVSAHDAAFLFLLRVRARCRWRTSALNMASVTSPRRASKQRLGIVEGRVEGIVYRLLDETVRRVGPVADREQQGGAERRINVAQRDLRQIASQGPSPAVAFFGSDKTLILKTGHDPSEHDRIGVHRLRQNLGRHGTAMLRHVKQNMKHTRQSAIPSHATSYVARWGQIKPSCVRSCVTSGRLCGSVRTRHKREASRLAARLTQPVTQRVARVQPKQSASALSDIF